MKSWRRIGYFATVVLDVLRVTAPLEGETVGKQDEPRRSSEIGANGGEAVIAHMSLRPLELVGKKANRLNVFEMAE